MLEPDGIPIYHPRTQRRQTCGRGSAAAKSMNKSDRKYLIAIFCGSVTSSPLPETRELGATYAILNFITMCSKQNKSATVLKHVTILLIFKSIFIQVNFSFRRSTESRQKYSGSMKRATKHVTRKILFHFSTSSLLGSSIRFRHGSCSSGKKTLDFPPGVAKILLLLLDFSKGDGIWMEGSSLFTSGESGMSGLSHGGGCLPSGQNL